MVLCRVRLEAPRLPSLGGLGPLLLVRLLCSHLPKQTATRYAFHLRKRRKLAWWDGFGRLELLLLYSSFWVFCLGPFCFLRWLWELNALQHKKTHANRQNTTKLRKHFNQFDNTCAAFRKHDAKQKCCKFTKTQWKCFRRTLKRDKHSWMWCCSIDVYGCKLLKSATCRCCWKIGRKSVFGLF